MHDLEKCVEAQHLIFSLSFHDPVRCETISRLSRVDLLGLVNGEVQLSQVPDVEKGEVLADSRGQDSFQRLYMRQ